MYHRNVKPIEPSTNCLLYSISYVNKATTLEAKATYLKAKNTTVSTAFIPDN